ncbi:hypothetical protein C8Q75DRAFT_731293 [Abortiporus biennis]|nr:hypothetical protein C8Q75DRAFT_731293 [Abortiporus biennis]
MAQSELAAFTRLPRYYAGWTFPADDILKWFQEGDPPPCKVMGGDDSTLQEFLDVWQSSTEQSRILFLYLLRCKGNLGDLLASRCILVRDVEFTDGRHHIGIVIFWGEVDDPLRTFHLDPETPRVNKRMKGCEKLLRKHGLPFDKCAGFKTMSVERDNVQTLLDG